VKTPAEWAAEAVRRWMAAPPATLGALGPRETVLEQCFREAIEAERERCRSLALVQVVRTIRTPDWPPGTEDVEEVLGYRDAQEIADAIASGDEGGGAPSEAPPH
jgi:hypothetical protein